MFFKSEKAGLALAIVVETAEDLVTLVRGMMDFQRRFLREEALQIIPRISALFLALDTDSLRAIETTCCMFKSNEWSSVG